MPPLRTLFPPPAIVPDVSINFPSVVTTRHRLLKSYAHRVAVSRSGATRVFPTARYSAGATAKFPGVIRSNNLGAFSGVSIARSCAPFFILSSGIKLARPNPYLRRKSRQRCAPAVVCTTMWSSIPHAVDTATSYFSTIDARSPSRPNIPTLDNSPPFLAAFKIPATAFDRVPLACIAAFDSSARAVNSAFLLASEVSFSARICSSPCASLMRSFDLASSSSRAASSARFEDCVASSEASSFSAALSCFFARVVESSISLTSVLAVSSAA
mmetsp:Transcript_39567/g.57784  ORF Transcript_39567/g.57784 Transcript_39567/m.57784 type:complete len:270 (-) Transcript_39567:678-1487(-)